jgi:hypothetical protein
MLSAHWRRVPRPAMTEAILVTLAVLLFASARSIIVRMGFIVGPIVIVVCLAALGGLAGLLS